METEYIVDIFDDIYFDPIDPNSLRVDIISKEKGRLATLIDSNIRDMSMCRVSTFDHLIEPRDKNKYSIQSLASILGARVSSLPPGTWVLQYSWSKDSPSTLGCISDEQGANALLNYIHEHKS